MLIEGPHKDRNTNVTEHLNLIFPSRKVAEVSNPLTSSILISSQHRCYFPALSNKVL